MDEIREQLLRRSYLYADARAYEAGVDAALAAVALDAQADAQTYALPFSRPHVDRGARSITGPGPVAQPVGAVDS